MERNTTSLKLHPGGLESRRIPSLDGLRAICILFVIFSHSLNSVKRDAPALLPFFELMVSGAFWVQVFFILSGFLITQILVRELNKTGRISFSLFYARRALRIFPAFYAYLAVIGLLGFLRVFVVDPKSIMWAGLYLWNYQFLLDPERVPSDEVFDHFWSLSIEEHFYLCAPLTLALLKPARAVRVAIVLIALMPISRVATALLFPAARPHIFYMTHTNLDNLMLGCLGGMFWEDPRFQSLLRRLDAFRVPLLSLIFVAFISRRFSNWFGGKYVYLAGMLLEGMANSVIVFWCVRNAKTWIGRVLNHPVMVHLGALSYSLYLWQQLFLYFPSAAWPGWFPYNWLCTFAAAELSYWLIERPCLKLRTRLG